MIQVPPIEPVSDVPTLAPPSDSDSELDSDAEALSDKCTVSLGASASTDPVPAPTREELLQRCRAKAKAARGKAGVNFAKTAAAAAPPVATVMNLANKFTKKYEDGTLPAEQRAALDTEMEALLVKYKGDIGAWARDKGLPPTIAEQLAAALEKGAKTGDVTQELAKVFAGFMSRGGM